MSVKKECVQELYEVIRHHFETDDRDYRLFYMLKAIGNTKAFKTKESFALIVKRLYMEAADRCGFEELEK